MLKFGFWTAGWGRTINSKFFREFAEFLEFPKILSLKLLKNLWDNSYIHWRWRELVIKRE